MKKFKNPYFSLWLAFLVLFVSCSRNDSSSIDPKSYARTTDETIKINKETMNQLQAQYGTNYMFDDKLYSLNDNNEDVNFEIAINSGFIKSEDKEMINQLSADIENVGFESAISKFQDKINIGNFSELKTGQFNQFILCLQQINHDDATIFARNHFDCGLAILGFACAFIGLATLEVGTGGLATAGVVVGYCAASTALVYYCRK
jgi:hypothetical protein